MTTACHLVYAAAGHPERDDFQAVAGPCWWCGLESPTGRGWPLSRLSSSFQGAEYASAPTSQVVCAPCAWTMGVGFALPRPYALERIRAKAEQGRRVDLARGKALILRLDDGRVGLWSTASGGKEAAWTAAVPSLRADPRDVGPCEMLGIHDLDDLEPGLERFFQSFHHLLVDGVWTALTDADKPALRAHLLRDDLRGPGVTSLVTTQGKHTLIHTPVEWPETGARSIYFDGPLHYRPAELRVLLDAVESLRVAGASREEIENGDYGSHGGLPWLRALRGLEPVVRPYRGGRLLDLALHLCRPWPELKAEAEALATRAAAPTPTPAVESTDGRPDLDAGRPDPASPPVPTGAGDRPADRPHRPAGTDGLQYRLF